MLIHNAETVSRVDSRGFAGRRAEGMQGRTSRRDTKKKKTKNLFGSSNMFSNLATLCWL